MFPANNILHQLIAIGTRGITIGAALKIEHSADTTDGCSELLTNWIWGESSG